MSLHSIILDEEAREANDNKFTLHIILKHRVFLIFIKHLTRLAFKSLKFRNN